MRRLLFSLVAFWGLQVIALDALWAQDRFNGNVNSYVKRIPISLESMYNILCEGAMEREEIMMYAEGFSQNYAYQGGVFIPDFMEYKSKSAQFSVDNYILAFANQYASHISKNEQFVFHVSNVTVLDSYWTSDKNGIMINVVYDKSLTSNGKELYSGKSQAIVVFPKLTDLFDVRLQQLSPYKVVEVKTNNGLLTDLNDPSKEIEKGPNSEASLSVEAAEQGDAEAQCELGLSYVYGVGVQSNFTKAVEWFCKSAAQGNAEAQFNLGVCYKNGHGVTQNYSKAIEFYKKAAEQGHILAQYNLGTCYYNGHGVEINYKQAVEWFTLAAEKGYAAAQYMLGLCYDNGSGVSMDFSKAIDWYYKAANQGNIKAKNKLKIRRVVRSPR